MRNYANSSNSRYSMKTKRLFMAMVMNTNAQEHKTYSGVFEKENSAPPRHAR